MPLLLALTLLFAGCAAPAPGRIELVVFAAASLNEAFRAIAGEFESQQPDVHVSLNLAGSQELRTQLEQGARADVIATADTATVSALGARVRDVRVFAHNRLVVIVPKANPAHLTTLADLARPGVKLDLADAAVPAGAYALQMLDRLSADPAYGPDFKTRVEARVISKEQNVRQVVSKVALGEADAGIVYATDAQAALDRLTVIPVPAELNIVATYPIAVVSATKSPDLAERFIGLVLGNQGQALLARYGFEPP